MATHKLLGEQEMLVIETPTGDLTIKVRGVFGERHSRSALAEIHGSPLISEGSLVDLTQAAFTTLSGKVRVKVANDSGSQKKLALYIDKPQGSYKITIVDGSEYAAPTTE